MIGSGGGIRNGREIGDLGGEMHLDVAHFEHPDASGGESGAPLLDEIEPLLRGHRDDLLQIDCICILLTYAHRLQ